MKRYRGENPSYTKWARSWLQFQESWWLWPSRPMKKRGAFLKRRRAKIAEANATIHRALAHQLPTVPDFRVHWDAPPSAETQAAMAEVIAAASKHFAASADYTARQIRSDLWQHTFTYPDPFCPTRPQ